MYKMRIFKLAIFFLNLLIGQKAFSIEVENNFKLNIDDFNKNITLKYLKTLNNSNDSLNLIFLQKDLNNQNIDIEHFFKLLDKYNFSKTKCNLSIKIDSIKKKVSQRDNYNSFFYELEKLDLKSLKKIDEYYLIQRKKLAPDFQSAFIKSNNVFSEVQLKKKDVNLFDIKSIIILSLFMFIFLFFFQYQKLKKEFEKQKINFENLNNQFKLTNNNRQDSDIIFRDLNSCIIEKDKEIIELKRKLDQIENKQLLILDSNIISEEIISEQKGKKIKYFKSPISDGTFRNEHQSDVIEFANTMFKFEFLKDEKTAKFEFCGDEKVIRHAINFSELNIEKVCFYTNTKNNFKTQIITIEPGIAELVGDKWIVKQKAKIKFD